jgi:tetratricopeptide (TPR) repeat protein
LYLIDQFEADQQDVTNFGRSDFLRRKARLLMLRGSFREAEAVFLEAKQLAETQGAAIWRLRAATDLSALRHSRGRVHEAIADLRHVIDTIPTAFQGLHRRRAEKLLALWQ